MEFSRRLSAHYSFNKFLLEGKFLLIGEYISKLLGICWSLKSS